MDNHSVILVLGSNHNADLHIPRAIELLGRGMADIAISTPLRNPAIGISSPDFTNCVMQATTNMDWLTFVSFVKETERLTGRTDEDKKCNLISVDIDILLYDNQKYHLDDWNRPYVTAGLKELSARLPHLSAQHNK